WAPEAVVEEHAELAGLRETSHRFFFPHGRVAFDVIADFGRKHEEAAIDPVAVAARLFLEAGDAGALMVDGAEAAGRLRAGHGRQTPLAAMERDAFGDVDVGHAVAVGQAEGV